MAELLIYVPGASPHNTYDGLHEAGLGRICSSLDFPSPQPIAREVATGPAEEPGMVYGYQERDEPFGITVAYLPHKQDWQRVEVAGASRPAWLGRDNGRTHVSPQALKRYTRFPSVEVLLDDGQSWLLPLVKDLPRKIHFAGGRVTERIKDQYAAHFEMGTRVYEELIAMKSGDSERTDGLSVKDAWLFVVEGLAMNYCLTPEIVDYLGLLTDQKTLLSAAGASVEYPLMMEWNRQKKTTDRTPDASVLA